MSKVNAGTFVANAISPGFVGYAPADLTSMSAGTLCFPTKQVDKSTGTFYLETRTDAQRLYLGDRAPGGKAQTISIGTSQVTFSCYDKAHRIDVTIDEINDAAGVYNWQERYTRTLMAAVLRTMEDDWSSTYFTTGLWGTDQSAPSTKWDSASGGDPVGDVSTALGTLSARLDEMTGMIGVCGYDTFRVLQKHPAMHDFAGVLNAQGVQLASKDRIAAALGLDDLIVSNATKVTSREGATAAQSKVVGDGFLVLKYSDTPFTGAPHAGALVVQEPLQAVVKPLPEAKEGSMYVECWAKYDFVTCDAQLGVFIQDVLT